MDIQHLKKIAKLIRSWILTVTTERGSGHPTSSLSATDLMTALMFGGTFRFDIENPHHPNNDRLIFSKGHATPLFYSLWRAAGKISEKDFKTYRAFGSVLEGHPVPAFPYTEAATGSLGQGLSVGVGMALNAKLDALPYRTYVLLGDSEMAEGSVWEAMEIAAHYKLDNLIAIVDVNRLGQRGETLYGHDLAAYRNRASAFGWRTISIDGHHMGDIVEAYQKAQEIQQGEPIMIIARTIKGKGVHLFEDKNGWDGKVLSPEELVQALKLLGEVEKNMTMHIAPPQEMQPPPHAPFTPDRTHPDYPAGTPTATREAYGNALVRLFGQFQNMVVLDAEVSNSTYADTIRIAHPERFFEMYLAEQNMIGTALGFARRGKLPFVSTYAAFFTRAFDQIRMAHYSDAHIVFVGSHAGVSVGEDGASQMGLEDIAMFRTLLNGTVLYPADAVAAERLVEEAAEQRKGIIYIRTTREKTPILYGREEKFPIGKSKILKQSGQDQLTIVAAGITLHESLAAAAELETEGLIVRVIDLYSIHPIDLSTLQIAIAETGTILTVEDHYPAGGIGEAVASALVGSGANIYSLAVRKMPKSGKPEELRKYESIDKVAIVKKVREILQKTIDH